MSHKKSWACIKPGGDGCDGNHYDEQDEANARRDKTRHEAVRDADRYDLFDASSIARGFNAGWDAAMAWMREREGK